MTSGISTIHTELSAETAAAVLEKLEQAVEAHRETQAQTRELLEQARAIKHEIHALLGMPRELVEEARQQVSSLTDVSKKISGVVQQLMVVFDAAQQHRASLEKANADAGEKAEILRVQTERVGHLVGVIRRLHGSIDTRIERLRGRLSQTDDLFRTVPREIENLRSLLNDETEVPTVSATPRRAPLVARTTVQENNPETAKTFRSSPTETPRPPRVIHRSLQSTPANNSATSKATLGDMVRQNQKLNEWLKQMVGEDALTRKIESLEGQRFDRRMPTPNVKAKSNS